MAARNRWSEAWPLVAAGLLLGALWPFSAYAVSPTLMPGAMIVAGVAAVVVRRPEYGIALVIALAPWINLEVAPTLGDPVEFPGKPFQLIVPALAIGVVMYILLLTRAEHRYPGPRWLSVAVLIFVGAALASSMQALHPSESVSKVVLLLTAGAVFFAVSQACHERRQLLVVVGGALLGLFLASTQGVIQHYSGDFGQFGFVAGGTVVQRVQGAFGHPNQYGGFIAVLIPLAIAVVATKRFPASLRWLAGSALGFAVLALVFSYARGAIVALVVGSLVWLAVTRPRIAAAAAVAAAVAAVAFAPSALKERFDPQGVSGDVPLRADIWNAATDIYAEHPLLGVGVDNFSIAYAELPAAQSSASQRRLLHQDQLLTPPHAQNQYLNIMAEEGLIGLAAFALLALAAVAVLYRGSHLSDPVGRVVCIAIGAGVMTLAVHSLLDVNLFGEVALPLFGLLAVAAGFVALEEHESAATARPTTAAPG